MCVCVSESVRGLEGEGMCNPKHNELRGNLYFVFEVVFPENSFMDEKDLKVSVESSADHPKSCPPRVTRAKVIEAIPSLAF